jgi:hypothetical protein
VLFSFVATIARRKNFAWMVRSVDFLIDLQRTLRVTERPVQVPFMLKRNT